MPKLHELQEQRSTAVAAMRAIADKAEKESRDYSDDENKRHKTLKAEITDLDAKIERARDLADAERHAPAIVQGNGKDGQFEERARSFSITKAISARLGDDVDAGFEREISQEVAKRSGRKFEGIAVPDEVFFSERRTLLAGSSAADLIPNVHRPDLFIDRLRSALITGRLGATVLDNLVGDVDIPRQTGSSTAQWVAEDGSLAETDAAFDDVKLTPKTVGAMTSFSRRTMINAVPAIEQLVRRDLSAVIANAIDAAALLGDGTGNTPTGVANTAGVFAGTLATPAWAEVLAMIAGIQMDDADIGSMGWAMNANAVAKLRSTNKVSGEPEHGFLMMEPGNLAGYAVATSTALPGDATPTPATVLFGAFSQLLIGYWSGTDILVNPYAETAYAKGRVMVRVMRDCDVQVRHAESFAVAEDLAV
ncbi:phage major capsid protein [Nitratireductor sp. ZSWI3]|uniref:phage major capsid protein n=1 Tax=Nitratireductor sp. ZSWI3 TaxID=2966359 RepID=UPI00214FB3FC|nr:phage major capsid protein [Nitratireductor sp. ZSWI3]MCR4267090.1 phage major capsid protein [Nitratireductor sp. ZSWI3]